jgi:ATP-dependent DNA helicase RecG
MNAATENTVDPLGRLKGLGITSLPELLLYLPRGYRDYTRPVTRFVDAIEGETGYFVATLRGAPSFYDKNGAPARFAKGKPPPYRAQVTLRDTEGNEVRATTFGNTWPWMRVAAGEQVHLSGVLRRTDYGPQISSPEFVPHAWRNRVVPLYPSKRGVASQDTVSATMALAIKEAESAAYLVAGAIGLDAKEIAQRTGILNLPMLLKVIHAPRKISDGESAIALCHRLAALQIITAAERMATRVAHRQSVVVIDDARLSRLVAGLPYALTAGQRQAAQEIVEDLRSPYPMRRLLSGDVGTGKTVTYLAPAVAAVESGASVAILTPNQLLVSQIANEIRAYFPGCPVTEVKAGFKGGLPMNSLLVGTTALLSRAAKEKRTLSMVIVDEQHKLSQSQREALIGAGTNLLEATATAVPRTQALVTHGGMDVSLLTECPVVKNISSSIVHADQRGAMFQQIKAIVAAGGQVAVIYPLVSEKEEKDPAPEDDLLSAGRNKPVSSIEEAAVMWEKVMPGRIGVLHGRMDDAAKVDTVERMKRREFDVLVSSTVIEIGVTLPDLRALLVVNAERYGVAQLHQMRGRVARHGGDGAFLMYLPTLVEPESMERLQLLVDHQDGFVLAEKDMEQRGFGDLSGDLDMQTGRSFSLFIGLKLTPQDLTRLLPTLAEPGRPAARCRP